MFFDVSKIVNLKILIISGAPIRVIFQNSVTNGDLPSVQAITMQTIIITANSQITPLYNAAEMSTNCMDVPCIYAHIHLISFIEIQCCTTVGSVMVELPAQISQLYSMEETCTHQCYW